MKYWRGFLVALIFVLISMAATWFASGHTALVDMVYPYMTRLIITTITQWTADISGCLWQTGLFILVLLSIGGIAALIFLKRNPIRLIGWILAIACGISMCNTLLYGLNDYAGPINEDVRLTMTDYTVSELTEATKFYRDKANALAEKVERDSKGNLKLPKFEELAEMAGGGFYNLTYKHAISLFAGSTVPVKKLGWTMFYGGVSGVTVALTGEACVNPNVPNIAMPYAMCKEMAKRMTIAREEDSKYAAFLACAANDSEIFKYSGYCIAYYYCYNTLAKVPTSTAQDNAKQLHGNASQTVKDDLADFEKFFGKFEDPMGDSVADMLTSDYIQAYITPLSQEVENPFDPYDKSQLDLEYVKPNPTPLKDREEDKKSVNDADDKDEDEDNDEDEDA